MIVMLKDLVWVIAFILSALSFLRPADSLTNSAIPKCTEKICEDYRTDPGCPDVSNCTGILLPSPTKCSCCQYCLDYIEEGGECSPGVPGQVSVQTICGAQLTCGKNNVCVKMSTPCMDEKALFEEKWKNGALGGSEIEPNCDDVGDYAHLKCIPGSICFCSSPTGERIFGEMINMFSDMTTRMDCACSQGEWRARNRMKRVAPANLSKTKSIFARCLSSGSYDMLQCVQKQCTCVDKKGVPQPPDAGKKVEYVYKTRIGNGKPWCFNLTHYHPGSFDTPCLKKRGELLDEFHQLEENEGDGVRSLVLGSEFVIPKCDPDGSYSRIQQTWERKYCVDPDGNELHGPDGIYSIFLNSSMADNMDCNCARTVFILKQWNEMLAEEASKNKTENSLPPLMVNIPNCCPSGNFASWQCVNGVCYCVDNNGAQTSPDVPRENVNILPCYNNNNRCPSSQQ